MRKPRVNDKVRRQAHDLVRDEIAMLMIENYLLNRGFVLDNFHPWNKKARTIKHKKSGAIFTIEMSKEQLDELANSILI